MKVLHLVKTAVGATWAVRQVRELSKNGVNVHVAIPPGGNQAPRYAAAGAVVHRLDCDLPSSRPWGFPKRRQQLLRLVDEVRPDLIHSHNVGPTLLARLALGRTHGIPRLFQVPGPLHVEHDLYRRLELATAGNKDFWIGSCRATCDLYKAAGVAPSRIFLSYYGTDTEIFVNGRAKKLRGELGVNGSTKLVGMVAYFNPPKWYLRQRNGIKGHEDLIDALAILRNRGLQVVGVFVGGSWSPRGARYERRVKGYAKKRCGNAARFLWHRSDVVDLYPDFDVAVHPSLSENVGGAVESLLMAVPTIATNVGGFPDLVRNGDTGWLVPPSDTHALASAIERSLRDEARSRDQARRGQVLAKECFNVRRTAREVHTIYELVLDQSRAKDKISSYRKVGVNAGRDYE
jgi:glycosyltransferase involved in cell wall biosynthesis